MPDLAVATVEPAGPAAHGEVQPGWLYDRVEAALQPIADRQAAPPSVEALAKAAGVSPVELRRAFRDWVGISAEDFLQYLTLDRVRAQFGPPSHAGLWGPRWLRDLVVTHEAITPGKRRGERLVIRYGYAPSPFGECLLLLTERGICGLAFVSGNRPAVFADMAGRWPAARFVEDRDAAADMAARVFGSGQRAPLPLHLYGTSFQMRVWEALIRIPSGGLATYGDLAASIGDPRASRAVGAACGSNPVSWLVPCHRAVLKSGHIRHYAWGRARKLAMIGWEAAAPEGERRERGP